MKKERNGECGESIFFPVYILCDVDRGEKTKQSPIKWSVFASHDYFMYFVAGF